MLDEEVLYGPEPLHLYHCGVIMLINGCTLFWNSMMCWLYMFRLLPRQSIYHHDKTISSRNSLVLPWIVLTRLWHCVVSAIRLSSAPGYDAVTPYVIFFYGNYVSAGRCFSSLAGCEWGSKLAAATFTCIKSKKKHRQSWGSQVTIWVSTSLRYSLLYIVFTCLLLYCNVSCECIWLSASWIVKG